MIGCNSCDTPEELGAVDFQAYPPIDPSFPFKAIVGKLIYLAHATRPDICLAVNIVARTNSPTMAHHNSLKRILRYLSGASR